MKTNRICKAIFLMLPTLLIATMILPAAAIAAVYSISITDVPVTGVTAISTYGINDSGDIAGVYWLGDPNDRNKIQPTYGFTKVGSTYTMFDFPYSFYRTIATGINDSGQIVGWYEGEHGFTKTGATYTTVDYPDARDTMAYGINDSGVIVGWYYDWSYITHGFTWDGLTYTTFDYPDAWAIQAFGINNSGQIVGRYLDTSGNYHSFIKNGAIYTTFDYPGAMGTNAYGINDRGQIVGCYCERLATGDCSMHGFIKDGSTFTTFDVPGAAHTYAYGINNSGQIVGSVSNYPNPGGYHFVATPSAPPAANAGPDQVLHNINKPVSLDGSGSTGSSNLTYSWSVDSAPSGSTATFSNPTAVNPTFTPDLWGDYILRLTVTDADGLTGTSTVQISLSSIPVAAATADPQAVIAYNTIVHLDGSQSYNEDGEAITYQWSLARPTGSEAVLSDATSVNPIFVADVFGDYCATLTVTNLSNYASQPVEVHVSFNNLPPQANAGVSQAVALDTAVQLDGSSSFDPEGDSITYQWSFVSKPQQSEAALVNAETVNPGFVADWPGTYVVQLKVFDGLLYNELPSTVQIQVSVSGIAVISRLQSLSTLIGRDIPAESFKNNNMKKALLNKINAVIAGIDAALYQDAFDQMQNDILGKTDGCGTSHPPAPDKNDWLLTCPAQGIIYEEILDILVLIQELM